MGAVAYDLNSEQGLRRMSVPDDLFRRRTVWRRLEAVKRTLQKFDEATDFDNKIAAQAAYYDLAAEIVQKASPDNTDLVELFQAKRDAAIERAKQRKPLRVRQRRAKPEENGDSG
jgi:hypothetical protein